MRFFFYIVISHQFIRILVWKYPFKWHVLNISFIINAIFNLEKSKFHFFLNVLIIFNEIFAFVHFIENEIQILFLFVYCSFLQLCIVNIQSKIGSTCYYIAIAILQNSFEEKSRTERQFFENAS